MDGSRLKVLYISRGYTVHDRRFLSSFVGEGWDVTHLPLIDEKLEDRRPPNAVRIRQWKSGTSQKAPTGEWHARQEELRRIIGDLKPDVIIAGPVQTGAYLPAIIEAGPLVTVSWGTDMLVDADLNSEMRAITDYTLSKSVAVFGDCRAVREAVKRHSKLTDSDIVTFPWGIDLDTFSPGVSKLELRQEPGWKDAKVFISTRTWEAVYAIDVLIEAFALVRQAMDNSRLILLGDGSQNDAIRSLIHERGLDEFVHAPGRVPHTMLPDYFRTSDVYVSSALSDGTSVSLLEAMATGLPVVVSDSYGNLEWVEPSVNGELARPGDAESLADAMIAIASDPKRAGKMRDANIALARERADWPKNFPLLARKVESLVKK